MQGDIARAKAKDRIRQHSSSSFSHIVDAVDDMKIDDLTYDNNNSIYKRPLPTSALHGASHTSLGDRTMELTSDVCTMREFFFSS